MRFLILSTALLLLAACATPGPSAPTAANPAPSGAGSSRVGQLLAAAGRPDAPTQSEIERALGPADIARQDGAGAALTYRLDSCALLLLFASDGRNVMRLTEAHPGARRSGEAAPSLETCAAEAGARRS